MQFPFEALCGLPQNAVTKSQLLLGIYASANDGFAQPKSVIVERISQCNGLATSRKLGILHCARNVEDNRIRVQGAIPVRALRGTRRRRALREDADLERLDAVADAGRAARAPSLAHPSQP